MTLKHLAGRRLVFEGLLELPRARLLLLEQPRVLDGDDGLVGESRHKLNLLLRERIDRRSRKEENANWGCSFSQERYREPCPEAPDASVHRTS